MNRSTSILICINILVLFFAGCTGDLVDSAHHDFEWAEWFKAGGWVHAQWTNIPVLGLFSCLNRTQISTI